MKYIFQQKKITIEYFTPQTRQRKRNRLRSFREDVVPRWEKNLMRARTDCKWTDLT